MRKAPVLLLALFVALAFACIPQANSVKLTASPTSVNSGFASTFTATPSGGSSPYTYAWSWTPTGTTTTSNIPGSCLPNSAACAVYGTASSFTASVSVTDSSGTSIGSATYSPDITVTPYHCIIGTATDLGSCIADSIPIAGVGILLSLSFVAIAFMLGEVLKFEGLSNWYKTELWETTKSMLIVAVI